MKVAVVGATGLVGREMLKVLTDRRFSITELIPVASERSVGQEIQFGGKSYSVIGLEEAVAAAPDIALFSAGGETSLAWAKRFTAVGTTVIDNSSAWRLDPEVPLIVSEVNPHHLGDALLIANPNCTTMQLAVALAPLHQRFGLKRVVVSTYQSVTGTGEKGRAQLEAEENGGDQLGPYAHPVHHNVIPHCDVFLENGYTKEEMKVVWETRKIFDLPELALTCTAVRVPVLGGHSESVNVEFNSPFTMDEAREALQSAEGLVVMDDPASALYPTPLFAQGKDEVFIGRIRLDESQPNSLNFWVVADNLRKGAATNAVQIAELVAARMAGR